MEYFSILTEYVGPPDALHYSVLAIIIMLVFYFLKTYDRNKLMSRGFPGLKLSSRDILGHLKHVSRGVLGDITSSSNVNFFQTVCGYITLLMKEKLCVFWVGFHPFIVLFKAESVEELLRSTTMLEKSSLYTLLWPWLGTGLLTSNGAKWKSRRKLLTPSFHFDILKDFLPVFNEQAQQLVKVLKEEVHKEWTDIVRPVTLCTLDIICETTLGVSIGAQQNPELEFVQSTLRTSASTMARMLHPFLQIDLLYYSLPVGRQFKRDLRTLHGFTRDVIHKKKSLLTSSSHEEVSMERKRKALMDLLLDHHMKNQDFTEEDIREEVDTFAFEGHDTTSMGVSWTLYLLGLYPEVRRKVQEELDTIFHGTDCYITPEELKEMKYLECVIKESQRLFPSVPMFGRKVAKGDTIGGHPAPEGATFTVFTYMLHRDPAVFPNPEVFNPDRFLPDAVVGRHPYAYIPFSGGPRNCIGQRFAMMEMKTVVATVLRHFDLQSLDPRDKLTITADLILRPVGPIRIKVSPRKRLLVN